MPDIRYVVIHKPGPNWKPGLPMTEQQGVREHVDHYRQLLAEGRLVMGGPFLDGSGGMMIPEEGLSEQDILKFAHADPAVASGLLTVEVRHWMVGMKKDPIG